MFAVISIAGCTSNAPVFSWYHPAGGEYLFAFDKEACETDMLEQGLTLGVDQHGPFFQCMHQRGYYLVDNNGVVHSPDGYNTAAAQQAGLE
ncbi:MAG: hypothetical protein AAF993_01610 [Pseudomonadota bacterium]